MVFFICRKAIQKCKAFKDFANIDFDHEVMFLLTEKAWNKIYNTILNQLMKLQGFVL